MLRVYYTSSTDVRMSTKKAASSKAKRAGRRKPDWAKVRRFSVSFPGPMGCFLEERAGEHHNGLSGWLQDLVRPRFEADAAGNQNGKG